MAYFGEIFGALPERDGPSLAKHLDGMFPNVRYVWITRRDKVRQAVSLVKARQSRQWMVMSQQERFEAADYNFHLIEDALRQIVYEECAWEEYFTNAGITPLTVIYEDLVRNYDSTVRRLLDDLDIEFSREFVFPPPRLHRQADVVSEEWVQRYHRDERSSRIRRKAANLPALLVRPRLRKNYALPRLRAHTGHLAATLRNRGRRFIGILPMAPSQARSLAGGHNGSSLTRTTTSELLPEGTDD